MKIIIVEKFYYPYSGIQDYCIDLVRLLQHHGHDVVLYDGFQKITSNITKTVIEQDYFSKKRFLRGFNSLYSFKISHRFAKLLDEEKPDIIHINNIYHYISPTILWEAKKRNIPVVYHLHDSKLVCPIHSMYRSNHVCMECKNQKFFSLVKHRCSLHKKYAFLESIFLYIESILHHRFFQIYQHVSIFITPSTFLKNAYVSMGWNYPIVSLPCFSFERKNTLKLFGKKIIVYYGRLIPEKGIMNLIRAVEGVPLELLIIGKGPQLQELKEEVKKRTIHNVSFLGFKTGNDLIKILQAAHAIVVPSLLPESGAKAIIESFALGVCVIGTDRGANAEMITDGYNGFLFSPGDEKALKHILQKISIMPQKTMETMKKHAYKTWKEQYSSEIHYKKIKALYELLLNKHSKKTDFIK